MIKIVSPKEFINRPDVLVDAGDYIKPIGKNLLLVGTPKSIEVIKDQLFHSLEKAGINYTLEYFHGYPTLEKARTLHLAYEQKGIDAVVAVGGGRVTDLTKVVGSLLEVPVITIPTIAATCASWAAVSVIYDDEGNFRELFFNNPGPALILADTRILLNAPIRYTYAGVVDTFAKWYELTPYLNTIAENTDLLVISDIAKRAFNLLKENALQALDDASKGIISDAAIKTIDSIIFLAGLTGSIKSDRPYSGVAHTFYNLSTQFIPARHLLHGEKVAFGLLLQQVLQQVDEVEIGNTISLFSDYSNLFTLKDFGADDYSKPQVSLLAKEISTIFQRDYQPLGFDKASSNIESAIYKVDRLISTSQEYQRSLEKKAIV